jgi:hypothetical protein
VGLSVPTRRSGIGHGQRNNQNGILQRAPTVQSACPQFVFFPAGNRLGKDRVPVEFLVAPHLSYSILNTVSPETKYGSFRLRVFLRSQLLDGGLQCCNNCAPKHRTRGTHVERDWRLYLICLAVGHLIENLRLNLPAPEARAEDRDGGIFRRLPIYRALDTGIADT